MLIARARAVYLCGLPRSKVGVGHPLPMAQRPAQSPASPGTHGSLSLRQNVRMVAASMVVTRESTAAGTPTMHMSSTYTTTERPVRPGAVPAGGWGKTHSWMHHEG